MTSPYLSEQYYLSEENILTYVILKSLYKIQQQLRMGHLFCHFKKSEILVILKPLKQLFHKIWSLAGDYLIYLTDNYAVRSQLGHMPYIYHQIKTHILLRSLPIHSPKTTRYFILSMVPWLLYPTVVCITQISGWYTLRNNLWCITLVQNYFLSWTT